MKNHFGVEARLGICVAAEKRAGACRPRVVEEVGVTQCTIRDELNIAAWGNRFEPVHVGELRREAGNPVCDVGPEGAFVVGGYEAPQAKAPCLRVLSREAEASEGNRN